MLMKDIYVNVETQRAAPTQGFQGQRSEEDMSIEAHSGAILKLVAGRYGAELQGRGNFFRSRWALLDLAILRGLTYTYIVEYVKLMCI